MLRGSSVINSSASVKRCLPPAEARVSNLTVSRCSRDKMHIPGFLSAFLRSTDEEGGSEGINALYRATPSIRQKEALLFLVWKALLYQSHLARTHALTCKYTCTRTSRQLVLTVYIAFPARCVRFGYRVYSYFFLATPQLFLFGHSINKLTSLRSSTLGLGRTYSNFLFRTKIFGSH